MAFTPKTDLTFYFTDGERLTRYDQGTYTQVDAAALGMNNIYYLTVIDNGRVLVIGSMTSVNRRGVIVEADLSNPIDWAVPDVLPIYYSTPDTTEYELQTYDYAAGLVYDPVEEVIYEANAAFPRTYPEDYPYGEGSLLKWSLEGDLLAVLAEPEGPLGENAFVGYEDGYRGIAIDWVGRRLWYMGTGNDNYGVVKYDLETDVAIGEPGAFEQFPGTAGILPAEAVGVNIGVYGGVDMTYDSGTQRLLAVRGDYWSTGFASYTDGFSRTDAATMGSTETGVPFTRPWFLERFSGPTAVWGTDGDEAYSVSGGGLSFAYVDINGTNGTYECAVSVVSTDCGVVARYSNTANYFVMHQDGRFLKNREGSITTLHTGTALSNGDVVKFITAGASVSCYVNDVLRATVTDDPGYYSFGNGEGFGMMASDSTARFDDWSFVGTDFKQLAAGPEGYLVAYDVSSVPASSEWYDAIDETWLITSQVEGLGPYLPFVFWDSLDAHPDGTGALFTAPGLGADLVTDPDTGDDPIESDDTVESGIWWIDYATGTVQPVPLDTAFYGGWSGLSEREDIQDLQIVPSTASVLIGRFLGGGRSFSA